MQAPDGSSAVALCLPSLLRAPCQSLLALRPFQRGTRRTPHFLRTRFGAQYPYVATSPARRNDCRWGERSTSAGNLHPVRSISSRRVTHTSNAARVALSSQTAIPGQGHRLVDLEESAGVRIRLGGRDLRKTPRRSFAPMKLTFPTLGNCVNCTRLLGGVGASLWVKNQASSSGRTPGSPPHESPVHHRCTGTKSRAQSLPALATSRNQLWASPVDSVPCR